MKVEVGGGGSGVTVVVALVLWRDSGVEAIEDFASKLPLHAVCGVGGVVLCWW